MTVKLLVDYRIDGKNYKVGESCDTDDQTEAGLIASKMAIADLTGATTHVEPVAQAQYTPVTATTNPVTGGIEFNGVSIAPAGSCICAAFGDSITAQNTAVTATQSYLYSNGYMTWATVLSGGKLFFAQELNFGVNGDTTEQMVARLITVVTNAKALGASYCAVLAGTNDIYSGVSYDSTIANLTQIYSGFLSAGITPIVVPIIPRAKNATSGSMLTAERQKIQRINTWIRRHCRTRPALVFADPTLNIVDHSLTNGDPIGALLANSTAYTYDGLHPSARGAFWIGKAIADAMQYRLSGTTQAIWSAIDTHDITNNPTGNLLANGYMSGTTGTNGTGSSGSVATSFTARRATGSAVTVVCSKGTVANANGTTYANQRLVCVGGGAGSATESIQLYQQIYPSGTTYAVGDTVYAECEVSVSAVVAATLKAVYFKCADDGLDSRIGHQGGLGYLPDQSWSGVMRSPSFVIKAGTTAITVSVNIDLDNTIACGATVDIGRMALRKVA